MKNILVSRLRVNVIAFFILFFPLYKLSAQCNNADFSTGDFTGWTGTYSLNQCSGTYLNGTCLGCGIINPLNAVGFNQGPNNDPPSDATTQYSHIITTVAGGNDPNITSLGGALPMTYSAGSGYAMRQGNMWQNVGTNGTGDGETSSYSFLVTTGNANFTYHYAVVLNDGGHNAGEQPYFNIAMTDSSGNPILSAGLQVDATTAATIGGFNNIVASSVLWKPWTSVTVPLNSYIGQIVKLTFTTRGCTPSGCAGSHYAYAYVSAECAPISGISVNHSLSCGDTTSILTAPSGATSYKWTGPGITSSDTTRAITADTAGRYSVTLITPGSPNDTITLDTVLAFTYSLVPNFSTSGVYCAPAVVTFADSSTSTGPITSWSWDFGDGGHSSMQNPIHSYTTGGTFPVVLTVTSPPCTIATTINVKIKAPPTATFTANTPVCVGQNSTITYTGNGLAGDTYNWNFSGGNVVSGSALGPYQVNWSTAGVHMIILNVVDSGPVCFHRWCSQLLLPWLKGLIRRLPAWPWLGHKLISDRR